MYELKYIHSGCDDVRYFKDIEEFIQWINFKIKLCTNYGDQFIIKSFKKL